MDLGLEGATVLITGSSRGIGFGIADAFLREGATVVLNGRNQADLDTAKSTLSTAPTTPLAFLGDLTDEGHLHACAEFITNQTGRLDHLVCNIGSGKSVPVLAEDDAEFHRVLDLNLHTAQKTVHALLPLLEANGANGTNTSITFVSSICGCEILGCPTAYAAAKSALNTYAKTIARPLGNKNIRVNLLSPGNVLFPGSTWEDKLAADKDGVETMLAREVPLARLGTLEEIADIAVFLASKRAGFVTGANWIADGGQTRGL